MIWIPRRKSEFPAGPDVPSVHDFTFHGPMRMRTALANSYNIPAVQTLRNNVAVDYYINFLRRLG